MLFVRNTFELTVGFYIHFLFIMACSRLGKPAPVDLKEEGLTLLQGVRDCDIIVTTAIEAVPCLVKKGCKEVFALDPFIDCLGYKGDIRNQKQNILHLAQSLDIPFLSG